MLKGFTYEFDDGVDPPVAVDPVFEEDANLIFGITRDKDFGFYRRELSTPLKFRSAAYAYLKSIEDSNDCVALALNIYHKTLPFFSKTARFQTSHFRFDNDNCSTFVGGDSVDAYDCFVSGFEDEINILTGTTKTLVNSLLGEYERIECSASYPSGTLVEEDYPTPITDCISPGEGWTQIDQLVNTGGGTDVVYSTYIREVYVSTCDGSNPVEPCGTGWILIDDNCPTNATYARAVPVTDLIVATQLSAGELYRATAQIRGGVAVNGAEYNNIPISNGVRLSVLLTNFLLPCGLAPVSDFFSINGDDTFPANDVYAAAKEKLQNLVVFQKSDVKRAGALNDATNGKWTLKGVFGALKAMFDIQFRIVGSTLRLEHRTYFADVMGEDLTATQPERLVDTNNYTYDTASQISEEKWRFMESVSNSFEGVPYKYDCFDRREQRKEEYVIEDSNNDVGSLIGAPDAYADAGFTWVNACVIGGVYYLESEVSALTGEVLLNGHLSIPNLMRTYHTYDRPRLSATWDGDPVLFDSARRTKIQPPISFRLCAEDFAAWDESALITTGLGAGQIESADYDTAGATMTVNLRY